MFTGIITHIGVIEAIEKNSKKDLLLKISLKKSSIKRKLEIGCSIALNGICLTLISKKLQKEKIIFSFQASKETCDKTTLKNWKIAQKVNLEFALRLGDEFGGHIVLGHVDSCSKILAIEPVKDSHKFTFQTSAEMLQFIASKGSITIDGISLTVNETSKNSFAVNIIPHTLKHTTLANAKTGELVNLEIDPLARYIVNYNNRKNA